MVCHRELLLEGEAEHQALTILLVSFIIIATQYVAIYRVALYTHEARSNVGYVGKATLRR